MGSSYHTWPGFSLDARLVSDLTLQLKKVYEYEIYMASHQYERGFVSLSISIIVVAL